MKRIATSIAAGSLLAACALAQPGKPGYTVIDLGPVGNTPLREAGMARVPTRRRPVAALPHVSARL